MGSSDEGKFMVAVGALIENSKTGKILLLKRSDKLDYAAGHWEIITGRMKQFEEIEDALKREIEEESGLTDIQIIKPLRNTHFFRGEKTADKEIILMVYWVKTDREEVKISWEHNDFAWLSPEDAKTKTNYPEDIDAFLEEHSAGMTNHISTGILIENSTEGLLDGNNVLGYQRGIHVKNSKNITASNNLITQIYGNEFTDVVETVKEKGDKEAHEALSHIENSPPEDSVESWITLGKKFGGNIGRFSLTVLSGIISNASYTIVKSKLAEYGINI